MASVKSSGPLVGPKVSSFGNQVPEGVQKNDFFAGFWLVPDLVKRSPVRPVPVPQLPYNTAPRTARPLGSADAAVTLLVDRR